MLAEYYLGEWCLCMATACLVKETLLLNGACLTNGLSQWSLFNEYFFNYWCLLGERASLMYGACLLGEGCSLLNGACLMNRASLVNNNACLMNRVFSGGPLAELCLFGEKWCLSW